MPTIAFLKEQIERARRFAMGMTSTADRDRFLAVADDYQRQVDAASASSDSEPQNAAQSSDVTPTTDTTPTTDASPIASEAPSSDAVSSSDDDEPTTTSTSGQPETD